MHHKRTGTSCSVWPLMISVLLLLWTLAACRRLWRGRYVYLNSSLFFWFGPVSVSLLTRDSFISSHCSLIEDSFSMISLKRKAKFNDCFSLCSPAKTVPRTRVQALKCWVPLVTGPTAHLCFFSFLHECVLPVDEGDQDGSLYFLLSRCCFACVFLPCCWCCFLLPWQPRNES